MPYTKSPSYLHQRYSTFYFRFRIPGKHRIQLGCTELHWPLITVREDLARFLAQGIAQKIKLLLSQSMTRTPTITAQQIKQLVLKWRDEQLAEIEESHALSPPLNPYKLQNRQDDMEHAEGLLREDYASRTYHFAKSHVAEILNQTQIQLDPGSDEYRILCAETAKRLIELTQAEAQLYEGKPLELAEITPVAAPTSITPTPTPVEESTTYTPQKPSVSTQQSE